MTTTAKEVLPIFSFKDIKENYPNAALHPAKSTDPGIESIPFGQKFIWLPTADLSAKERIMLQLGSGALFPVIDNHFRPWYPILFEHQPINETGDYRLLQVKFTSGIDLLQTEWLQEIQQMLPHVVDLFFVTEDSALIVEQRAGENLRLDELDGLFVALDMDFDCYSHLFVGPFHHSSHDFTLLLTEEMTLFQQLTRQTNLKSLDLATSLIHLLSTAGSDYQLLFRTLYQDWFQESDLIHLIESLWKNQGNASSTAKSLFMHRNTLLYKIDKFQSMTNLNLKEMDDLLLCYFLIKNFAHPAD